MKTLSIEQTCAWINEAGLIADPVARKVSLPDHGQYVFTVRLPQILPYQVANFANAFLPWSPEGFQPFLFWLKDNDASGEIGFELACRMATFLREAHGERRPLLESPGYLFTGNEIVDGRMILTMALLFSWDAYVVPEHGRYFIWIDDDEFADVCCKSKSDYDELLARFRGWSVISESETVVPEQ